MKKNTLKVEHFSEYLSRVFHIANFSCILKSCEMSLKTIRRLCQRFYPLRESKHTHNSFPLYKKTLIFFPETQKLAQFHQS